MEEERVVKWGRTALILVVLGATLGPVLDGLHTWSGTTWYAAPQWMKSVWWCPPLFAFAAVSIGLGRLATERWLLRIPHEKPTGFTVSSTLLLFIVMYAFSAVSKYDEVEKAIALMTAFIAGWWRFDRSRGAWLGALGAGLGGWLVEHTLVHLGLFFHRDTMLDGVALWIPPLYFTAALALGALAKRIA